MNVRLVCVFASSSCIGAEPAAYVEENVESRKCDFRAVTPRLGCGKLALARLADLRYDWLTHFQF